MLTNHDLSQIQKIVRGEVQEELKPVKKDIRAIKKDINLIVKTFDRDYIALRRKVEDHLNHHSYPIAS